VVKVGITHTDAPYEVTQGQGGGAKRVPIFETIEVETSSFSRLGDDRLLAVAVPREHGTGRPLLDKRWLVFMRVVASASRR
jgi:hypothetical protein